MVATTVNSVGEQQLGANWCVFPVRRGSKGADFPTLGALLLLRSQQSTADHIQIRQGAGHEEPVGILHDPAVANLDEAEDPFEHADRMLSAGTHPRAGAVDSALTRREIL